MPTTALWSAVWAAVVESLTELGIRGQQRHGLCVRHAGRGERRADVRPRGETACGQVYLATLRLAITVDVGDQQQQVVGLAHLEVGIVDLEVTGGAEVVLLRGASDRAGRRGQVGESLTPSMKTLISP